MTGFCFCTLNKMPNGKNAITKKKHGKKPCCRRIAGNSVRSSFIPTKISLQAYNHQTTSRPSNRPRRITSRRTTTTTHLLLHVPWASLTVVDSFIHSMENTIFGHMSSSQIIVSIIMLYNNDDDEPPTGQPTKGQATWNSKQ